MQSSPPITGGRKDAVHESVTFFTEDCGTKKTVKESAKTVAKDIAMEAKHTMPSMKKLLVDS